MDLRGQRALVTGGGRRLGAAIAGALGAAGMDVAVHHRASAEGAEAVCARVAEAGGQAFALQADLRDRDEARSLVDRAVAALGGLDVLVLNAASYEATPYDAIDGAGWDRTLALNLTAPFVIAHRATAALREAKGSMVFLTCVTATRPCRDRLPYVVSKGALRHLMRVMALELAPDVRVNAVAPGTVLPPADLPSAERDALIARTPLGRVGDANDVVRAVLHLCRSPQVTGTELVVDGGRSLG